MFSWPLIGIHAVLLPDGRVLTYGSDARGIQTGKFIYDVWDPLFGIGTDAHTTLPNNTAVDLFCSAQLVLPGSGDVQIFGGDITSPAGQSTNNPNADVTLYRFADNSLTRTATLQRKRWYATATTLPNGEIFLQGGNGGADYPEVRATDGKYRLLSAVSTQSLDWWYPHNFVGPDGNVFGLVGQSMYRVRPLGTGSMESLGRFAGSNIGHGSAAVMFAPSRILQLGGGTDTRNALRQAHVIDISERAPKVTAAASMVRPRHWSTAAVLPDGRVFVSGGALRDSSVLKTPADYPDKEVAYTSELYDPATNKWSDGATATRMRLYHSTSLLLPDATVLTLGGGAPGPQTNLSGEIYYPPYLFDATGKPAPRPTLTSAPMTVDAGGTLALTSPEAATVKRVVLIKTGSVTHSFDMDQRRLELSFARDGERITANLPALETLTPPGYYMLFLVNEAGTPSRADILRINARAMTRAYNGYGIFEEGAAVAAGGLDGSGYAYASGLLGKQLSWNGSTFVFGPANGPNTVSSATIELPAGKYSVLNVLAAAGGGDQAGQTFVVTYADGSQTSFKQGVTDWYNAPKFGEAVAITMPARLSSNGSRDSRPFRLFGYRFTLDSSKAVRSLTLPNNSKVRVLGVEPKI
ncbi:galactose oxidase-like domain-containing protein [Pseudomonas sp. CGJS7]|uniref:galactose oxidase-like domain-containing protein n=1 Tax=Pseudomonas sp. CGJS7 TaxID=3109348 RepID=UPI00300AA323